MFPNGFQFGFRSRKSAQAKAATGAARTAGGTPARKLWRFEIDERCDVRSEIDNLLGIFEFECDRSEVVAFQRVSYKT